MKGLNQQFISRNQSDFADLLVSFRELNKCYSNQFILSLYGNEWVVFDTRVSRDIVSFDFKNINNFKLWCKSLMYDICNVSTMHLGNRHPRQSDTWSLKHLSNIYSPDELYYFTKL